MFQAGLGELAAFGTALGWGISSIAHGAVGRMLGSTVVTLVRAPFQLCAAAILCLLLKADTHLTTTAFAALFMTGFFGLALCDLALYRCMYLLGPRLAILLLSLSSVFTVLLGIIFLHEHPTLQVTAGILATTLAVAFVVTERSKTPQVLAQENISSAEKALGVFCGLLSALFLSCSFIFLKFALQEGTDPVWAGFIRVLLGGVVLWGGGLFTKTSIHAAKALASSPTAIKILIASSLFSASGFWLSSVALHNAPVGVAATLMGLQPLVVTIFTAFWEKRLPSWRATLGTLAAFGGTALICFR